MLKKLACSPGWLIIIALGLRFLDLGRKCFWLDEAFSYEVCRGLRYDDTTPMLFYQLVEPFLKLPFSIEFNGQLLPAIFGILTVFVIYLIGLRLVSKKYALIAGLLAAVNPVLIVLSQDMRAYGLAAFLTAVLFLAFVNVVKIAAENSSCKSPLTENIYFWYFIYILAGTIGLYAHYIIIPILFILALLFLFIVLRKIVFPQELAKFILANAAIVLLFLPYLTEFLQRMSIRVDESADVFYSIYSLKTIIRSLWGFNLGYVFKMSWLTHPLNLIHHPQYALLLAASVILLIFFAITVWKNLKSQSAFSLVVLAYALLMLMHLFIALSDYRQIFAVLIPFILILSYAFYLSEGWKKYLMLASLLISLGGGLTWYYSLPYSPLYPADFRAAAKYLENSLDEGEAAYAFMTDLQYLTFDQYCRVVLLTVDDRVKLYHSSRDYLKRRETMPQLHLKHFANLKDLTEKYSKLYVVIVSDNISRDVRQELNKYREISVKTFGAYLTIIELTASPSTPW